jgi:hypothetical protein
MIGTPQEQQLLKFWKASAREWRRRSNMADQAKGEKHNARAYVRKPVRDYVAKPVRERA